jgi:hypothetical protein
MVDLAELPKGTGRLKQGGISLPSGFSPTHQHEGIKKIPENCLFQIPPNRNYRTI